MPPQQQWQYLPLSTAAAAAAAAAVKAAAAVVTAQPLLAEAAAPLLVVMVHWLARTWLLLLQRWPQCDNVGLRLQVRTFAQECIVKKNLMNLASRSSLSTCDQQSTFIFLHNYSS